MLVIYHCILLVYIHRKMRLAPGHHVDIVAMPSKEVVGGDMKFKSKATYNYVTIECPK